MKNKNTRYERQQVIDIETGEILQNWKHQKREYKTVNIEIKTEIHENTKWIKTERHVKHNGQQSLIL